MNRARRRIAVVAAVGSAIVVSFAGCGGSNNARSAAARVRLAPLVEQVRHSAESGDQRAALLALTAVRQAVAADAKHGDIGAADAAAILAAAATVETRLSLISTTTTAAPTTTTTTVPDTSPGNAHGPGDKHKDGGKGGDG
jgi:hypothetical protein